MTRLFLFSALAMLLLELLCPGAALGQQKVQPFTPPMGISYGKATIFSEGVRLAAELFAPGSKEGQKLPTIVMCHGWGGTAAALRPDAITFARAGYFVVTFDYRGWGGSDSRLILAKPPPENRVNNRFSAEVIEVREVVDPLEQTTDLLNAIHWVQDEP